MKRRRRVTLALALGSSLAAADASAQTTSPCTARPAASFHLRPRAVEASIGRRFAARTELVVLDATRYHTRGLSHLRRVRVVATGATGFAYIAGSEFGPNCVEPELEAPSATARDAFSPEVVRRGPAASPEAGLVAGWTSVRSATLDVDQDGQQDQLLSATREGRYAFVVALRRAQGWELQVAEGPVQEPCAWEPAVARGADTWLRLRCISQGETGYSEAAWLLFRFDPRARTVRLAALVTGDRLLGGDSEPHPHRWRFEIPAPNALRITGDRGAPLLRRFDATQWTWQ